MSDVVTVPDSASRPNRIDRLTPKVRKAIDLMVWDGKPCDEAAREVGLTTRAMRLALAKPHILAAMKREMQVLRSSERPRDIRRLHQIRDAADNMPAIQAVRTLLSMDGEGSESSNKQQMPGLVVQVNVMGDTRLTQPAPLIIDNEDKST